MICEQKKRLQAKGFEGLSFGLVRPVTRCYVFSLKLLYHKIVDRDKTQMLNHDVLTVGNGNWLVTSPIKLSL